jgi:hypothetical protein
MVSGQKIVTLHTVILWSIKPVKVNFGLSNATFMWLGFAEKAIKLSQEQKGPNLEKVMGFVSNLGRSHGCTGEHMRL